MQTFSYSVFFVVQIGTVLHDSSRNLEKKNLTSCPNPNEWPARQKKFKCDNDGKIYICILNQKFEPTEICVYEEFVLNGTAGCPFIIIREDNQDAVISHPQSFHSCPDDIPGCPTKYHGGYKLSEISKYAACIKGIGQTNRAMDRTSITDTSSKSSTTIANTNSSSNEEDRSTIIILILLGVSVFVIIAVVLVVICKQKGRSIARNRLETTNEECSLTLLQSEGRDAALKTTKSRKQILIELNNYLKRCDYEGFNSRYSECLEEYSTSNVSLLCELDYLKIHSDIYQGKYSDAKEEFDDMMKRCSSLSAPFSHEVSLLTARMRLFVHTGEREKLEQTFNNISEKIEKDSCLNNQNFGWVYFNFSRYNQEMIILALSEEKIDEAKTFVDEAETNIDIAIRYFSEEQFSDEAKRSQGLAILEKIALKLRWFGKDNLLDRLKPQKGVIECCNEHLLEYKYLDIPTENDTEIKLQLLKTETIFAFRAGLRNNMKEKLRKLESMIIKHNRKGMLRELKVMKQIMLNT